MVFTDGSRYGIFCLMIDDGIQSCLVYGIQVSMSNRLYGCIILLKCICVMLCVIPYNEIYIKKLYCAHRSLLTCDLVTHCRFVVMKSESLLFLGGNVLS